ncbi:MAG TPA: hypothetical protein VF246_09205 [Acidimicrobiia bacterium]
MTFEQDPDLAGLSSSLGRELAEEAAEDERLTAAYDRRRFDMAMVAKDMVNRGARVSVVFSGHTFSGLVIGGGSDHVTVEGAGQIGDIRLDAGYWSILPGADEGGGDRVATDETIMARLAEAAERGGMVRLALAGGEIVIGRVTVVAQDHVELTDADDRALYVPGGLILAILRSSSSQ